MSNRRSVIPTLDELAIHAEAIVAEKGISSLTARSLAVRAGMGLGTLYNVSSAGMDAVVEQMNARLLNRLSDSLEAVRNASGHDGRVLLEELLVAYLDFAQRERDGWQLLLSHRLPEGHGESPVFSEARERAIQELFVVIRPMVRTDEDAKLSVIALWASLHGIVSLHMQGKLAGGFSIERVAQRVLNAFTGDLVLS